MRVRGLKLESDVLHLSQIASHPVRVRGLKSLFACCGERTRRSHPVRVRGLKSWREVLWDLVKEVAPRAGAWIEIIIS